MGADIHMYVEYRNGNLPWQADEHHNKAVSWHCSDKGRPDKYIVLPHNYCDACKAQDPISCTNEEASRDYPDVPVADRNYEIFAKLAGVRGIGPEPKGLPSNVSTLIAEASEHYGWDGHSHSWCTPQDLKEILEKVWNGVTHKDFQCSDDAFHELPGANWQTTNGYFTLLAYCERLKKEKNLDREIFGPDAETDVQVRLVFWFDN